MKEQRYDKCLRCHRKLKTEEARKIGYGKVCLEKVQTNHTKQLFSLHNMK